MQSFINKKLISKVLGLLLFIECFFLLLSGMLSVYYQDELLRAFLPATFITLGAAFSLYIYGSGADRYMGKREGYLIVTLSWVLFSAFGSLPYYISGYIPSLADSYFETMSGFTTTGSSILKDIERLPKSLLFWRALTHWLGGMGIVVFTVALLPLFKTGGMQLFMAEATGPTLEKIHPRIADTAKRLWFVYSLLTLMEVVMLYFGGMSLFDSVCHSFATLASGGFSTKNASVAYWDSPYIHYVITLFMFLSGINFTLLYFACKGKLSKLFSNEEFRWYGAIVVGVTAFIACWLYFTDYASGEKCFRDALFQVVSIITTTGFATADFMKWSPVIWIILIHLMFIGGSAGSTNGGPKVIRIIIVMKNIRNEFRRFIHPNAVIPVKFNKMVVQPQIVTNVMAFLFVYVLIILFSTVLLSSTGLTYAESFSAALTALSNVGPGVDSIGPASNFSDVTDFAKWFMSFLMLVGRLEIFTVLLIFTPYFWKE